MKACYLDVNSVNIDQLRKAIAILETIETYKNARALIKNYKDAILKKRKRINENPIRI